MSTAEIVRELGEELDKPGLSFATESVLCACIERLVELEPDNAELDGWRVWDS